MPNRINADIEIPSDVKIIVNILKKSNEDFVYVVGGAIRDWVYCEHNKKPYKSKDIDLATNLSKEEIINRLQSNEAKSFKINIKEKQSIETFGVVFVTVDGSKTYEVSSFRKDIGLGDGRHPKNIETGTMADDAARRDFTMNSLYYDIDSKEIIDFNFDSCGINDAITGHVRTVGDPDLRFKEDKLRILRMIRFFSRYNDTPMIENISTDTIKAIFKYKNLLNFAGISHERIQTEFLYGIDQCKELTSYLKNYRDFQLFDSVFPDIDVDFEMIDFIQGQNTKNHRVILAILLHFNKDLSKKLKKIKYSNETINSVQFLVDCISFDTNYVFKIIKFREKIVSSGIDANKDLMEFNSILKKLNFKRGLILDHLIDFHCSPTSGYELMKIGYSGPDIGEQQKLEIQKNYSDSLKLFLSNSFSI